MISKIFKFSFIFIILSTIALTFILKEEKTMQKPVPQHVIEYARAHGYTCGIDYIGEWNSLTVYSPDDSDMQKNTFWGLPSYILTKGDMIRWANADECEKLMDMEPN